MAVKYHTLKKIYTILNDCFPTLATLKEKTDLSQTAIFNIMTRMKIAGIIKMVNIDEQNCYSLKPISFKDFVILCYEKGV